jgi:chemotaxis protein CheD
MGHLESTFLLPGQLLFSTEDRRVTTILGSCVSVVVHDRHRHFGGLCHYLLPSGTPTADAATRYGTLAIPLLLERFFQAGSRVADLAVAVVGGGLLMDADTFFFVGDRNVSLAKEVLAPYGFASITWDCGGSLGRKLTFRTGSGHLEVRFIRRTLNVSRDHI